MKLYSSYLRESLKDPILRKEFLRVHTISDLADQIMLMRNKRGYSQNKLAELSDTTQAVVSRVENGSVNSSINTIQKLAEAMNAYVQIAIIPEEEMAIQEFFLTSLLTPEIQPITSNFDLGLVGNYFRIEKNSCFENPSSSREIDLFNMEKSEKALA